MVKIYKATQPIGSRNIYDILRLVGEISESILFVNDGRVANAKSMLGLMSLAIQRGDEIEIISKDEKVAGNLSDYFTEVR